MERNAASKLTYSRKRRASQRSKTPKKAKNTTTRKPPDAQTQWIKNSFVSEKVLSPLKPKNERVTRRSCNPKPELPPSSCSFADKCNDVNQLVEQEREAATADNVEAINPSLASTPKHSSQALVQSSTDHSVHHDSFNDSDTLFSSLDLDFISQVKQKTPVQKRTKSSVTSPRIITDQNELFSQNASADHTNLDKVQCSPLNSPELITDCEWLMSDTSQELFKDSYPSTPCVNCDINQRKEPTSPEKTKENGLLIQEKIVPEPNRSEVTPKTKRRAENDENCAVLSKVTKRRSSLLNGRLLQTLLQNGRNNTPKAITAPVRDEEILQVANKVESVASSADLGPYYGLPSKVKNLLETHRGISNLYAWQDECLQLARTHHGRNLIYSLPTSGGKTLVAELLMFTQLLCHHKDALFILPFVSIVQEKVRGLAPFAVNLDFLVEEYAASKGQIPPRRRRKKNVIYVATIEKADTLINSLIDHDRLDHLGLVVVDELHMLGEGGSRGASLEMTLTKVMHMSSAIQIVGMSATLSNIYDLENFLQAIVYTNNFRPVELDEFVKLEDTVYSVDSGCLCPDDVLKHRKVLTAKRTKAHSTLDPHHLSDLVREVIPDKSCLVFCPTKKNCENVALLLTKLLPRELLSIKQSERSSLLKSLYQSDSVCPVLARTVPAGIAYHHSGLTMDERRSIEEGYLDGTLCVLACTSTLAAGVNLPAKRVIIKSPYVGQEFMSRSQYKQMCGRAGRAGLDTTGESFLIVQPADKHRVMSLVSGPCDRCISSLSYDAGKGFHTLLLTTIGLKITRSVAEVVSFLQRTLCYVQRGSVKVDIMQQAHNALQHLSDLGLIVQRRFTSQELKDRDRSELTVTALGRAVFKGNIDISYSESVVRDLRQAQQALCVDNYLHLLYLVTPHHLATCITPDWHIYLHQVSSLEPGELRVLSLINVPESYITKKASGQRTRKDVDQSAVRRFYSTLMLHRLWSEESVWSVADRFQTSRGQVQQLLSAAAAFASCLLHFCQELDEFWAFEKLLTEFARRLSHCVSAELLPLMEIPAVKIGRARQLHSAGYDSVHKVAHTEPGQLVKTIDHLSHKQAQQLVTAAQMLLMERVETLQDEVEEMVTMPTDNAVTMETTLRKYGLEDVF